jgi:hypothetical protein
MNVNLPSFCDHLKYNPFRTDVLGWERSMLYELMLVPDVNEKKRTALRSLSDEVMRNKQFRAKPCFMPQRL